MKLLKISLTVTVIVLAFLCSGLVAALNQDQATARALFASEILQAGHPVTGNIFFSSFSSEPLVVTAVSIHFDWMPTGQVVGHQLPDPGVPIESGSSHLFDPMQIQIPLTITSGTHTYYIGIDGTQNGTPFSWDSLQLSVDVTGGTGNVTASPSSTNSGGQPAGQPDLLLYGAIGAVVVIVALLIIVLMVRKKRPQPKSATKQGTSQPEETSPENKPDSEQDFNI